MTHKVDLVIISGRSGSGKTIALHALEDLGFYCIDNLPVDLFKNLVVLAKQNYPKLAVSLDIRNVNDDDDYKELAGVYESTKKDPDINCTIAFIDADDQVLIKRYSETRRLHPLSLKNLSLNEALNKETDLLQKISSVADLRIDTTNLSIHDLCQDIVQKVQGKPFKRLVIIVESFGFKDGIAKNADFVFDARFLPNPFWDKSIRNYCGLDEPIKNFFAKYPQVEDYINKIDDLILSILKPIESSDRSYLTIAIGCTGGFHRSVYIAQSLVDRLKSRNIPVKVNHRTLNKKGIAY